MATKAAPQSRIVNGVSYATTPLKGQTNASANINGQQLYRYTNQPNSIPAAPVSTARPAPSGGGGGGNSGGGGGISFPSPEPPPNINYDIQPAIDALEGQVPGLNQSEADQEAQINKSATTQKATADQQFGAQKQDLGTAADQARRQASEVLQGIQGRYGGSTGEGSFASALLGQSTQQTIAGINQKIAQVQDVHRLALQDIEDRSSQQINAAKQWLQQTLSGIRNNQSMLQAHKADLAFNAMQNYQQYLEQVNLGKQQLASQLTAQAQSASQQLELYKQTGASYVNSAPQLANPLSVPGQQVGQQQSTQPQAPGYIAPARNPLDDLLKGIGNVGNQIRGVAGGGLQ